MIGVAIPLVPLAAAALSALPLGRRIPPLLTLAAALSTLCLSLAAATRGAVAGIPGWVGIDGFSAVVLLLISWVACVSALYSIGYLAAHGEDARRVRHYCAHFNLFVFALVLVPVVTEPALAWIGIEFTAVFSVLLVAFDDTRPALEAAWKYIALMFMGAAIALLGFLILFWAQQSIGGGHYTWDGLRDVAGSLPAGLVRAAFLLILIGFGTKAGFVPMHTWLPDAHSQAPSPVCALLSGVKTTAALYVILRLVPLLIPGSGAWMTAFGLLSVGTAAFLLLQVSDYKRLFAYSTIEHMGIIFVAVGLTGPAAAYAALMQMVSHSVTKSFCFLAAGAVLLVTGTRDIGSVRALARLSPAAAAALLFGALGIGGAPPLAVFTSEFAVFRAAIEGGHYLVVGLLAAFVAIAFVGVLGHCSRMVYGMPPDLDVAPARPLPIPIMLALIVAAVPIAVLGLCPIDPLHRLLLRAVPSLLAGGAP